MAQARVEERELKMRRLWPCPDARPFLIEQFDRSGYDGAEHVVRPGEVDVEFGLVVARADIHIHAVQMRRRREVAPPLVVGGVECRIGGEITVLHAGLYA